MSAPVDEADLVDAALQLHRSAIGAAASSDKGHPPLGPGAVVLLAGTPVLIAEAETPRMRLATVPVRSNDWRSLATVPTRLGSEVTVEIVAAPRGPVLRSGAAPAAAETMRARALKRLGLADRAESGRCAPEPARLVTARAGAMCDEDGVLFPFAVLDLMQSTERLVHPVGRHAPCAHLRRLHVFEAVTPGDVFGVATVVSRGVFPAPSSQSLRSCLRRLADSRIVALCDTVLR